MLKKNKGITLIALIITIIIMLILVGISIQLVINSGLFETAKNAGLRTEEEYKNESTIGNEIVIDGKKYASMEDYVAGEEMSDIRIKLTMTHTETPVTVDGTKIKEIKEGAPIPVDFYYVGGTKNTGVVISDNSNDENAGDGHNVELEGNQFVWVPVLQNQKLKIEVTSEKEITGIKIEDPLLREITTDKDGNTLSPSGTSYAVEITPTINGTYIVTVNTAEETKSQIQTVTSLYAQDFYIRIRSIEELKLTYTIGEFIQDCSDEEGNIVEEWLEEDFGTTIVEEAYEIVIQEWFQQNIEQYKQQNMEPYKKYQDTTVDTYSNSVNTYGGFYIARYEAGCDEAKTLYSKKNMCPYSRVTQTQAISQSSGMYTKSNITSTLINAAAWDRTLNWLVETNAITTNEMFTDSKSWGNYYDSTFNFTGKYSTNSGNSYTDVTSSTPKPENTKYLLGTGVSDYTKRNNIYDLAGNCDELTTEVDSWGDGIRRGGNYRYDGSANPASDRSVDHNSPSSYYISFRPSLYIQ